jgi:hypothetical protein
MAIVNATIGTLSISGRYIKELYVTHEIMADKEESLNGAISAVVRWRKHIYDLELQGLTMSLYEDIIDQIKTTPIVNFTYNNTDWSIPPNITPCYVEIVDRPTRIGGVVSDGQKAVYEMTLKLTETFSRQAINFP